MYSQAWQKAPDPRARVLLEKALTSIPQPWFVTNKQFHINTLFNGLATTSLLKVSGRASEVLIGRSQVRLLLGALSFFF